MGLKSFFEKHVDVFFPFFFVSSVLLGLFALCFLFSLFLPSMLSGVLAIVVVAFFIVLYMHIVFIQ